MIRFFGVGRSTLRRGDVLRVFALIEYAGSATAIAPEDFAVLKVVGTTALGTRFAGESKMSLLFPVADAPGVTVLAFGVEVDTHRWSPGPYDMTLQRGDDTARLGESLWILDWNQYEELLEEELSGAEPRSVALLDDESATGLTTGALTRIVRRSFAEKLTGSSLCAKCSFP